MKDAAMPLTLARFTDDGTYTHIYPFPGFKVYFQDAIAPVQ